MRNGKHIKISNSIFCILICLINIMNGTLAQADSNMYIIGSGENTYNYQSLLQRYETNSNAYIRNGISRQIEGLSGAIASESFESLNNQYFTILQKVAELKAAKGEFLAYRETLLLVIDNSDMLMEIDTQIAAIDSQLAQYSSSLGTAGTSMADAKLQKEIADFYKINQSAILHETQNALKNDFLKRYYGLIIENEQINYYNNYQEYLELAYKVEIIKYNRGVTNQYSVDRANINLLKNKTSILQYQNTYNADKNLIQIETNIGESSALQFSLESNEKVYDIKLTIDKFIASNTTYMQLQNLVKSYQNYLGSNGTFSYATYQQVELKIADYQLQIKELQSDIATYVTNAIHSYEYACMEKKTANNEFLASDVKCNMTKLKMDNKKATTLELSQAKVDRKAAEITYYQACYEVVVWGNILDNCVYGTNP